MIPKMSEKLPTGLCNIGNTCFANSVLQCILHTPEMVQFLSGIKNKNARPKISGSENSLLCERHTSGRSLRQRKLTSFNLNTEFPEYCCALCGIKELMGEMEQTFHDNIYPLGLKDIILKVFGESVEFGRQQDAHEFLIMLLHSFEGSECLKKSLMEDSDDYSFDLTERPVKLNEIFEGSFTSTITCGKCRKKNNNIQKFQDINLDIKETFEDSMKYYFQSEKLEGDNQYDCRKCKKHTNAVKSLSLKEAPINLIINLKKFDKFGTKIKSDIKYPYQFDLNDYIGKTGGKFKNKSGKVYELYGVINHEGKHAHKGHYNCYVKGYDSHWYSCDDSKVKKIFDKSQKCSAKAYILFYRLISAPAKLSTPMRRISNVSTEMAHNEECKTKKGPKPKSLSKFNRKRRKMAKGPERSEKIRIHREISRKTEGCVVISRAMSEVSDCTSSSSKRSQEEEDDGLKGNVLMPMEISLEL